MKLDDILLIAALLTYLFGISPVFSHHRYGSIMALTVSLGMIVLAFVVSLIRIVSV